MVRKDGDELLFCAGDASGHENLGSLFLACLSNIVLHRVHHSGRPSVEEIVMDLDAAIHELAASKAMGGQRYITFFLGAIDLLTGELTYVNAGHPGSPVAALRRAADLRKAGQRHQPAGLPPPARPPHRSRPGEAGPGDIVLLYTDGATELLGNGEHRKGLDLLEARLQEARHQSPEAMVAHIAEILDHHLAGDPAPDDTTWMALRIREKELRGRHSRKIAVSPGFPPSFLA